MANTSAVKYIQLLNKSWRGFETLKIWEQVIRFATEEEAFDEEDKQWFGELGYHYQQAITEIEQAGKNLEKYSLVHFVAAIRGTELFTRYMGVPCLSKRVTSRLCEIFNDLSTEVCLSWDIITSTTTSSTTATGAAAVVDALESKDCNSVQDSGNELDTIGKLLQPVLGVSSTGSICSSISTQQDGALVQLKFPESYGYAIVEVNLALVSKVQHLDSNEAWKAYEYRSKIVVPNALDNLYIQATKLILGVTERLTKREDGKRTVFRKRQTEEGDADEEDRYRAGPSNGNKRRRNRF